MAQWLRPLVRSQMVSLEFFIDIILPIAQWDPKVDSTDDLGGTDCNSDKRLIVLLY